MTKYSEQLSGDTCWVYVIGYPDHTYRVDMSTDSELPRYALPGKGTELLLHRKFNDCVSAAGFCYALKLLSPDSVRRVLKRLDDTGK